MEVLKTVHAYSGYSLKRIIKRKFICDKKNGLKKVPLKYRKKVYRETILTCIITVFGCSESRSSDEKER